MTYRPFARAAEVDAARIIVAAATAAANGYDAADAVLAYTARGDTPDGTLCVNVARPVTAADVALGAASLIGRLFRDVDALMALSPGETLANAGAWVAGQEDPDAPMA